MGVVVRQGLKTLIVIYGMSLISIAASMYIYPLDFDLYGTLAFLNEILMTFGAIVFLGMPQVSIKYFPSVKERFGSGQPILMAFAMTALVGMIFVSLALFATQSLWFDRLASRSDSVDLTLFMGWIVLGILLMSISRFLSTYLTNHQRLALPKLIENITRFILPLIILGVILDWIEPATSVYILILTYGLISALLLLVLQRVEPISWKKMQGWRSLFKSNEIRLYAIFSLLTTLGSSFVFRIDTIFINMMLNSEMTGLYGYGMRIGNLMSIPMIALMGMVAPFISRHMHDKALDEVDSLYGKSSLLLSLIGVLMMVGLALIIEDLFAIIPNGDVVIASGGLLVVALIAFGRYVDMVTSVNSQIILYSKYYRVNLYLLGMLAVMNIVINLWLIPIHGIVGAAIATMVSLLLYNLLKTLFIYWKFKMFPFDHRVVMSIVIGVITYLAVDLIVQPLGLSSFVDLVLKSFLAVIVFAGLTLATNISEDVDRATRQVIGYLRVKLS